MINLSMLTDKELNVVDMVLSALDTTLANLEGVGAIGQDGVDLEDLYEATGDEMRRRSNEAVEFKIGALLNQGKVIPVIRPDGQVGYAPTGTGD